MRLALSLLALALLATPARAAAPETVTLVGWGGPEEKAIVAETLKAFERANPGYTVKYTQIPGVGYDYFNKLRLMIVAGLAPDVYYVPDGNFGELASRGVLLNLDPYVAKSQAIDPKAIWPSALARYRWDGRQLQRGPLYCLPKDIGPFAMFYNKDVFRARGIPFPDARTPWTWDQAVATWQRLTFQVGRIRHYGVSTYPHERAVWSSCGEIVAPDKVSWALGADPKSIAAVQWCADLSLVQKVAPNAATTAAGSGSASPGQLFESGLAACHFDGRWLVPRFRDGCRFDWDVAPVPVPKAGMKSVCWSGSVGLGVHGKSPRPQAAFKLVEFLAGPAGRVPGPTRRTPSGTTCTGTSWARSSAASAAPPTSCRSSSR